MNVIHNLQNRINQESVDEDRRVNTVLKNNIRTQVKDWDNVVEKTSAMTTTELNKITQLLIGLNQSINKAISGFIKSADSNLLNFSVNNIEEKYNEFAFYLQSIGFHNKPDSEKQKVFNAVDEVLSTLKTFKNRVAADVDTSANEKTSINNIYSNLYTRQFVILGAYSKVDDTTNREKNKPAETLKQTQNQAILEALQATAENTSGLQEKVQEVQNNIEELQNMRDSAVNPSGENEQIIAELNKKIESLQRDLAKLQKAKDEQDQVSRIAREPDVAQAAFSSDDPRGEAPTYSSISIENDNLLEKAKQKLRLFANKQETTGKTLELKKLIEDLKKSERDYKNNTSKKTSAIDYFKYINNLDEDYFKTGRKKQKDIFDDEPDEEQ